MVFLRKSSAHTAKFDLDKIGFGPIADSAPKVRINPLPGRRQNLLEVKMQTIIQAMKIDGPSSERALTNEVLPLLVAEDDDNDFFLLESALKRNGARVFIHRVKDGQEAIEWLERLGSGQSNARQCSPEVLLLDLKMPRKSGFEVIHWVRNNPTLKSLIVVVFSGSSLSEDVNRAYDLGANSYVIKPARWETLITCTAQIFQYWSKCSARPRSQELPRQQSSSHM